jgi:hypothetical protein
MANLVAQTDKENEAEGQARASEGTLPQVLNHRISWYIGAKYKFQYRPYLVQVSDITATTVTFQFVNGNSGKLLGTSHTIGLTDFSKVYQFDPSTLPTPLELRAGRNVSFLLLNSQDLGNLKADADASEPDDGKWPRVTSEETRQIARLKEALDRVLRLPGIQAQLPPKDWMDYHKLLEA